MAIPDDAFVCRHVKASDFGWVQEISKSVYGGRDYIANAFDEWVDKGHFYALVRAEDEDDVVAVVNIGDIPYSKMGSFDGLRVDPKLRGQGIGSKMVVATVGMETSLERFVYSSFSANVPSIGLAKKVGFQLERVVPYMVLEGNGGAKVNPSDHYSSFSSETFQEWADRLRSECELPLVDLEECDLESALVDIKGAHSSLDMFYHHFHYTPLTFEALASTFGKEGCFITGSGAVSYGKPRLWRKTANVISCTIYASRADSKAVVRHALYWAEKCIETNRDMLFIFLMRPEQTGVWSKELFGFERGMTVLEAPRDNIRLQDTREMLRSEKRPEKSLLSNLLCSGFNFPFSRNLLPLNK